METTSLVDEGLNKFAYDFMIRRLTLPRQQKVHPPRNRFKTAGTGLKSEVLFNMMNDFLAEYQGARVLEEIDATFAFEIIPKKGEWPIAVYDVDFKNDVGHVKFG